MKIRITDRLLVALAGLVLLALCAGVVAQAFFHVPLTEYLTTALSGEGQTTVIVIVAVAAALLLVGIYCVCMLFRHRKGKRGFVMQQTENGEVSIAVKAMEGLARQCVECHPEMKLASVTIDPGKDGVLVEMHINLASGVSIPLAVGALQKQVRTYLTSCSGVDVREVRVQVDTTSDKAANSPYAVPELTSAPMPLLREAETAAGTAEISAEKKDRPLHQRIFAQEEQPATVPEPPLEEPGMETAAKAAEEAEDSAVEACETMQAAQEAEQATEDMQEAAALETEPMTDCGEEAEQQAEDGEHEITE